MNRFSIKRAAVASALTLAGIAAFPASAWEAGVDGPLCTLTHVEDGAAVRLTFDPSVPLYTITISGGVPWVPADRFSMVFDGPLPNMISTDRHVLSPDAERLSVSDRGFGNVLDGLQFNTSARAISGPQEVRFSLEGAAAQVEIFRACGTVPTA